MLRRHFADDRGSPQKSRTCLLRRATGDEEKCFLELSREMWWIEKVDAGHVAQRFTPRRSAKSDLSETNKERVRRLIRAGLMTPAGLAKIQTRMDEPFVIPADILRLLKKDATTWKNFRAFPEWYRRIRIGWIEAARQQGRLIAYQTRPAYFLRMTAQNKRFGMVKCNCQRGR